MWILHLQNLKFYIQLLIQNPGIVFSKEKIYNTIWKESSSGYYNIIANHIRHIRKKIDEDNLKKFRALSKLMGKLNEAEASIREHGTISAEDLELELGV